MDEYQYWAFRLDGKLYINKPYRTKAALKSAMQTMWGNWNFPEEGIIIKRAKLVFDEDWKEEWNK